MYTHEITKENFESEVLLEAKPVLLDFWASWCGPCRMLSPVIEEIAKERADVKVAKVNVDDQRELALAFSVMSIPTLALMQDGKVVATTVGVQPKSAILSMLQRAKKRGE